MTNLLTGDDAEINAITRAKSEEMQKIFSNLPQKTQEMLFPKPTFFEDSSHDVEDWMQTTKDFAIFNRMELSFALDMLLRRDAKQLWQEFIRTNEAPTKDDVEKWFPETFSNVKTIYDIFKEL